MDSIVLTLDTDFFFSSLRNRDEQHAEVDKKND